MPSIGYLKTYTDTDRRTHVCAVENAVDGRVAADLTIVEPACHFDALVDCLTDNVVTG